MNTKYYTSEGTSRRLRDAGVKPHELEHGWIVNEYEPCTICSVPKNKPLVDTISDYYPAFHAGQLMEILPDLFNGYLFGKHPDRGWWIQSQLIDMDGEGIIFTGESYQEAIAEMILVLIDKGLITVEQN